MSYFGISLEAVLDGVVIIKVGLVFQALLAKLQSPSVSSMEKESILKVCNVTTIYFVSN